VWSISVCGMYSLDDVPADFPRADSLRAWTEPIPFNGGTAIARPGGEWLIEPVVGDERLVLATLDLGGVRKERLSFDATGHYARPDVFHVTVDRRRRDAVHFVDGP
jgi:nitrilase